MGRRKNVGMNKSKGVILSEMHKKGVVSWFSLLPLSLF